MRRPVAFVKAGLQLIPVGAIESVELHAVEHSIVDVFYDGGKRARAEGVDAMHIVMLLHPGSVEGLHLRWHRHAWAMHNLIAHPLMQVCAWLRLSRLGLWIHDTTVPRPVGSRSTVSGGGGIERR